ncbi:MAG: PAS domain-containing protein [Sandaracinus sp.]|nr:PAS domain-containing protein [Sandaracinus sp.]MCB9616685.1 PAS domain-containing protein [Sandaracinus sp.]
MSWARKFLDDITHEQLLDRLSLALDGASLGIWDWDLRDDSVQFDERWCSMLGLDHETTPMTLETWSSRVHPDDLDGCFRDIQAHLRGETPRYENVHRMRHADGEWRYILDRGRISGRDEHGKPMRFTGTHLDITESERARIALESQGRDLAAMIEHLPTAVAVFDRELRYVAASGAWLRSRTCPTPYVGRSFYELEPEVEPRWGPIHAKALEGEELGEDEARVEVPGGEQWFCWSVRPWRVGEEIRGIVVSFDDVTERVVARRAREQEGQTKLAALALFAGGVAHEINTPLQVVALEAELLRDELREPQPDLDELRRAADAVAVTTARASAITNALRTLARDATNDPEEPVDMGALLAHAEALCRSRCESVGITASFETGGDVWVSGRPAELLHIVTNLVDNALHAAAEGDRWVRVRAERHGERVVVRCVDGGPGVSDDVRPRLGTPFFTTKPRGKGTGLGLAIVDRLVRRGRGELAVRPGRPTTFEVDLPAWEEQRM